MQLNPLRTCWVNYCSAAQRAEDVADRIVLGLSPPDHFRPALKDLHWLPVVYHIKFKIYLLMYFVHMHCCPSYTSQTITCRKQSLSSTAPFNWWQWLQYTANEHLVWRTIVLSHCQGPFAVEQSARNNPRRHWSEIVQKELNNFYYLNYMF